MKKLLKYNNEAENWNWNEFMREKSTHKKAARKTVQEVIEKLTKQKEAFVNKIWLKPSQMFVYWHISTCQKLSRYCLQV